SKGLAIAALVLGLVGLIPLIGALPALAGVILGIVALARKTPGKGLAVAGIVTGAIGLMMIPVLLVAILIPSIGRARELAQRSICAANLNTIGKGFHIYLAEYEFMPPDVDTLISQGTAAQAFVCPSAKANRTKDYFFLLGGTDEPPGNAFVACDYAGNHSDGGRNVLCYMGSVKHLTASQFEGPDEAAFTAALKEAEGP
ncbi:hypothetical protein LCGC14_2389170, partial [marine sediment metagenome]